MSGADTVAAAADMEIIAYIAGPGRYVPGNYIDLEFDFGRVTWTDDGDTDTDYAENLASSVVRPGLTGSTQPNCEGGPAYWISTNVVAEVAAAGLDVRGDAPHRCDDGAGGQEAGCEHPMRIHRARGSCPSQPRIADRSAGGRGTNQRQRPRGGIALCGATVRIQAVPPSTPASPPRPSPRVGRGAPRRARAGRRLINWATALSPRAARAPRTSWRWSMTSPERACALRPRRRWNMCTSTRSRGCLMRRAP